MKKEFDLLIVWADTQALGHQFNSLYKLIQNKLDEKERAEFFKFGKNLKGQIDYLEKGLSNE